MKSLEAYLKENYEKNVIDFSIRATVSGGMVSIYIRPDGKDGETLDFVVDENLLLDPALPEELKVQPVGKLNPFQRIRFSINTLALCLIEVQHTWTNGERRLYQQAINELDKLEDHASEKKEVKYGDSTFQDWQEPPERK